MGNYLNYVETMDLLNDELKPSINKLAALKELVFGLEADPVTFDVKDDRSAMNGVYYILDEAVESYERVYGQINEMGIEENRLPQ